MLRSKISDIDSGESDRTRSTVSSEPTEIFSPNSLMAQSHLEEEFTAFRSSETLVSFNQTKLFYQLDEPLSVSFFAMASTYQITGSDVVGICKMQDSELLVSKPITQCETDPDMENLDSALMEDDQVIARKTAFSIQDLKSEDVNPHTYFQFCYKNPTGSVLGKSAPFRIGTHQELQQSESMTQLATAFRNDFLCPNDEDDEFVVVCSLLLTRRSN